jgi:dTDP-D-glucose 4,6-dehydratase
MNCIGERQDVEKFIPKVFKCIKENTTIPIYCKRKYSSGGLISGSRVYMHAKNVADAIRFIIEGINPSLRPTKELPDRFNVCGSTEMTNMEVIDKISSLCGKQAKVELVESASIRPGYDSRYGLDNSKLSEHGWKEVIGFEEAISLIHKFSVENPWWLE